MPDATQPPTPVNVVTHPRHVHLILMEHLQHVPLRWERQSPPFGGGHDDGCVRFRAVEHDLIVRVSQDTSGLFTVHTNNALGSKMLHTYNADEVPYLIRETFAALAHEHLEQTPLEVVKASVPTWALPHVKLSLTARRAEYQRMADFLKAGIDELTGKWSMRDKLNGVLEESAPAAAEQTTTIPAYEGPTS